MKNLACYPNNSFDVFTTAVARKTDLIQQAALTAAFPTLLPKFQNYDQLFSINQLEDLLVDGTHASLTDELKGLYNSNNMAVNDIRKTLQALQDRSLRNTCQYCTLESPNTMDHIVPKTEFPEFAIHPKNLIPSCGTCNGYKGMTWRIDGVRNLINFYIDQLPNVRYLIVDVFLDKFGEIEFQYVLRYRPGINRDLWMLILAHFTKLHLLDRMRKSAGNYLSEFQNALKPRLDRGEARQSLIDTTLESCEADRAVLGINHWKPAMQEALVRSEIFWDRL